MLEGAFTWLAALSAVGASFLWWHASRVMVPAPKETQGVGALLGGHLISVLDGKRIDLHATLDLQSKWNARAAKSAALSAIFTGFSLICKARGW